jgi:hypothetical protein
MVFAKQNIKKRITKVNLHYFRFNMIGLSFTMWVAEGHRLSGFKWMIAILASLMLISRVESKISFTGNKGSMRLWIMPFKSLELAKENILN